MGRIILGLLASLLLVVSSLPARANTLEPPLYDLLLRSDQPSDHTSAFGTTKESPSLCWRLRNSPPVEATMTFTLADPHSFKPVLEIQLANTQTETHETCYCVSLRDYGIQLEPYILYRWYISIVQNPESHSRDVVFGGLIERCPGKDCQIREMPSSCDRDFIQRLAIRGFWYDSISCLCDLINSSPDDKTLWRMLDNLMRQAGLTFDLN